MSPPPVPPTLPASMHFIERDWLSCNQVVFFDEDDAGRFATLVDSGYGKHAALTLELVRHVLRSHGVAPDGLRTLINTHLHSDHCGGNALLAREFGCRVLVPEAEFDKVNRWDETRLTYRGTGQRCERFSAQGVVRVGDELTLGAARWRVHAAPGHDPQSVILHCPQHRLLLSADALWENGFGVIFPELGGDSGFAEQRAVLELIATLEVDLVIPGHGTPFGDVPAALARAHARLDALSADLARNARNAIKVLIKFLLLDEEAIDFDAMVEMLRDATIMENAAKLMGMTLPEALGWGVRELERQTQIRRDGNMLYNREPALEGTY
jgi:glyoxylase-like metal-dependent hydrolase (beta-lactamase superfamily II)